MPDFFGALSEVQTHTWWVLAALVVAGIVLLATNLRTKWSARMLAFGAICLAASFVLSYITLLRMPQGGSVTLMSILPVMLFMYLYGFGPGLALGLTHCLLRLIQGVYFLSFPQFVLDYPMPSMLLAVGALCAKLPGKDIIKFPLCVIVGGFLSMCSNILSGILFFGEFAPEGMSPIVYSIVYNFTCVGLDTLICAIGAALLAGTGLLTTLRRNVARTR